IINFNVEPADYTQFELTTAEGFKYLLDQKLGATRVTDRNGNTLTISASGVTSSNGQNVAFTRDASGRITQITDLAGNPLIYSYNTAGDLSEFKDRVGNITKFGYDPPHLLTTILDPRGIRAVKSVYDASGRLTDTFDADEHQIHYDHQVSANTE